MDEVTKLLAAGFIREVHYPERLTNVVLMKKGKWEMENVRGLHRPEQGMPKGQFPFTKDRPSCGFDSWHKLLTFMDAFSGYK